MSSVFCWNVHLAAEAICHGARLCLNILLAAGDFLDYKKSYIEVECDPPTLSALCEDYYLDGPGPDPVIDQVIISCCRS